MRNDDFLATDTTSSIRTGSTTAGRVMAALGTPDLTAFQQLVYAVLVGRADGNACRTTIQSIADHLNRSEQRATVCRALEKLEQMHLVRTEKVAHGVCRYHLLDPPVRCAVLAGAAA